MASYDPAYWATRSAHAAPDARRAKALLTLTLIVGAVAALFSDAAASMVRLWISSSVYHHGLLAAPIAVWLILRRCDWRELRPQGDWAGVLVIAAASFAWLIGRAASVDLFGHVALVAAIIGAVILVYGRALASRWAFPLLFLFFMVPFGEELTPALQRLTSAAAGIALNASGVETLRDGYMLTTSAGRFEVAPSCAGLRFLFASAMISSALSYLSFATIKTRFAFIAAALGAAILANWLRVYVIVLAATATDRRIGVGPEHVALGWAFYGALIAVLIAFARSKADANFMNLRVRAAGGAGKTPDRLAMAAIAIAGLTALYDLAVVSADRAMQPPPALSPLLADGFHVVPALTDWEGATPLADRKLTTHYKSAAAAVSVSVAYFTHDRPGAEIAGADVSAADGARWRRIASRGGVETLEDVSGLKIDVATAYWLGDRRYADRIALKRDIALARLVGRAEAGGVIFVAAPRDQNADTGAAIKSFLANAETPAQWRMRITDR